VTKRKEKEVESNLVEHCITSKEVIELHRISGLYNFLVKVVTETLQSLDEAINTMGVYGDSTTLIVLSSLIYIHLFLHF
jgi:DNA-binding Lrp family transcriptional regulator